MIKRLAVVLAAASAAAVVPAPPARAVTLFSWRATMSGPAYTGTARGVFDDVPGTCAITLNGVSGPGTLTCNGSLTTGAPISISCSVVYGAGTISGSCTGAAAGTLTGVYAVAGPFMTGNVLIL